MCHMVSAHSQLSGNVSSSVGYPELGGGGASRQDHGDGGLPRKGPLPFLDSPRENTQ
jgi:hypothetical protein